MIGHPLLFFSERKNSEMDDKRFLTLKEKVHFGHILAHECPITF